MSFIHPFQKFVALQYESEPYQLLIAAAGPCILTFHTLYDKLLGQWPLDADEEENGHEAIDPEGRPIKRRKLSTDNASQLVKQDSDESVNIVAEREKGTRRRPKVLNTKLPNVSLLTATSDGRYVIAATAEDKSIIVLEVAGSGRLKELSRRCMPKRLCALTLTPDEETVVVGDKFGDVYSLPLFPSSDWVAPAKPESSNGEFRPSASEVTVHTRGNLDALRQQQQQNQKHSKKEGPDFEHKLLLGHVSLLTDVKVVELTMSSGQKRQYILTSDRDEHIRVSRGIKQAHIIENYCLGQKEFISTIEILPWNKNILVAGGGELFLRTYDWLKGELLHDNAFPEELRRAISEVLPEGENMDRLAVSRIWPVWFREGRCIRSVTDQPPFMLLAALERIPLLISCMINDEGKIEQWQALPTGGSVLDVALQERVGGMFVSIVDWDVPGSGQKEIQGKDLRKLGIDQQQVFVEAYILSTTTPKPAQQSAREDLKAGSWVPWEGGTTFYASELFEIEELKVPGGAQAQNLKEFLYGLDNLRKKRDLNMVEEGESDVETMTPETEHPNTI